METITTPTTNFPPLLTVKEVARNLRVHDRTVSNWIKNGDLEAVRLPSGVYRVKEETLFKMLPEN